MTPEQMRALAGRNDVEANAWRRFSKTSARIALHEESAAALRAAADQLEAVYWDRFQDGWNAAFTADTAPREDRDD